MSTPTPSPRRALLVIDVQNEYISGNFKIEYPDVQSSLVQIGRAMDAARAHRLPIVMVQHVLPPDAPIFAKGGFGVQLHPVVAERHYDKLVTKELPSTCAGTDFGAWLKENNIDTLAISGYMTHNCNDSTIRQAMHEGYQVEFLHDAAGSLPYRNRYSSDKSDHRTELEDRQVHGHHQAADQHAEDDHDRRFHQRG